jgi:hypothetical protein
VTAAYENAADMADTVTKTDARRNKIAHFSPADLQPSGDGPCKQGNIDKPSDDVVAAEPLEPGFDPELDIQPQVAHRIDDDGSKNGLDRLDRVLFAIPDIE